MLPSSPNNGSVQQLFVILEGGYCELSGSAGSEGKKDM